MDLTHSRLSWWRDRHPDLAERVAEITAFWPDEKALLMRGCAGRPLGRLLQRPSDCAARQTAADLDRLAAALGEWFRLFAAGRPTYTAEVEPLLGQQARRTVDGRLIVDARRLLERRIEQGEKAAHTLSRAGLASAQLWSRRFDLDAITASFSDEEPAGFVHGDVKPDNILVDASGFSVIDWWTTPRVSWPLTDVACFGGNIRLCGESPAAARFWELFTAAYYGGECDDRTRHAIDLISTIMCLVYAAERTGRGPFRSTLARLWSRRLASAPLGHLAVKATA